MAQPLLGSSPSANSPAASEPSATTLVHPVQEEELPRIVSLRERMSLFMADADIDGLMQDLRTASAPDFRIPTSAAVLDPEPAAAREVPAPMASRLSFRDLMSQHSSPCAGSNAQLSVYDSPCSSLGDGGAWASLGSSSGGAQALLLRGRSSGGAAAAAEPEGRVKAGRLHYRFSGTGSPSVSSLSPTPGETCLAASGTATGASSLAGSPAASGAWDFPLPPPSMWPEPQAALETRSRAFAFSTSDLRPRLTHSQSMSHRTLSLSVQCLASEPKPGALNEPKVRGGSNSGCGAAGKDRRVRGGNLSGQEAAAQKLSYSRARSYFPSPSSTCSIPELQELESLLERGFCSAPLAQALAISSGSLRNSLDERTSSEGLTPEALAAALSPQPSGAAPDSMDDLVTRCPLLHALSLPAQGTGFKVKLFRGAPSPRVSEQEPGPECRHVLSSPDP